MYSRQLATTPATRFSGVSPYGVAGHSSRVSGEIQADHAALMHRSRLCQELAAAEQAEAAAADRLAADDRAAAAATQQANDRARRADIATQNRNSAFAEYQRCEAQAKHTAEAAAAAAAAYQRATANFEKADAEMKSEVAGAEEAAAICANAQRALQNAVSTEASAAQVLSGLETDSMYPRYGAGANGLGYAGVAGARSLSPVRARW
jgi:colicin import membrane protein